MFSIIFSSSSSFLISLLLILLATGWTIVHNDIGINLYKLIIILLNFINNFKIQVKILLF